ncbi:MAG: choice-of-anchor D domain-containing protein [Candidatus Cloacimonetes bacterium]|nr:choice-of-anchor D domain-containing protein [Candidatus Cloacimonadota bacterium]MCF7813666.1 choice-of-anchor D domain-containing protein [Candidatus Cloacimonadota bacterium]MCF7867178.1 choice-of-anchor D domain-containing protein [Candidatus Cloacimonadota bacterium]MCF7882502.1 choice-of-anchor D domain-containing protein [Candidatus Cloacimonadota bacterium]
MKIKLGLICVLIFGISFLSAEWITVSEIGKSEIFTHRSLGLEQTEIEFNLDGYEMEEIEVDGETYQKISYFNEGKFLDVGFPDLPRFTRMYAIPDIGNVSFEINKMEEKTEDDIYAYPIQELRSESQPQDLSFMKDESFYNSNDVFPQNIIEIGKPVIFRDIRVVQVTINPFQYNAANRSLNVIENLELTITTDNSTHCTNPINSDKKLSRSFENLYKSVVHNYEEVTANTDDGFQDPCILFIYPNNVTNLVDNLTYLTDWKTQMGYEVHAVSTSETGAGSSSIKNYIQDAYDNWSNPPEFICLVGDANGSISIPTFFETYSGYGGEGDHPYTQLEGNDILADAMIGRLSVSSITELQTVIAKILNYEKNPFLQNTDWYDKAVMVGDPSTSGSSCIYTKQFIKETIDYNAPNIESDEYYNGGYSSGMTTCLNNGVSYFNYRGYIGMSSFGNSNINSLNNGFMLPFAVLITCDTGSFASSYGTARTETFLRAGSPTSPKGALVAIGTATSGTHTTFNNAVDAGTYYGVFVDHIYNPGGALLRGKLHLFNSFPSNPFNRVNIFSHWTNLMGDPSVKLWTGVPQPLTVNYEDQINVGQNYLEVTVTDDSADPVENAWVCALMGDDVFERDYTDADGKVFLQIDSSIPGTADLTVTAHNYIPHLGSFDVIEATEFINVENWLIDDDNNGTSAGNDNDIINPGETIELNVGLKNYGTQSVSDVTATLSSDNDFITITDDEETYGSIAAGNMNFASDDFDFEVAENVLGGTEIQFDVTIEDGSSNQWEDHIFLAVEGANLYVSAYQIDDSNGILDPGNTAEVIVTLFNTGSVAISGLQGMLSCDHNYITLEDSLANFETIQAGQEGDNDADRFEITLDLHAIAGSQIPFDINLTNTDGFEQNVSFLIDVGTVTTSDPLGPDSYGYYAYDSTDETYDQAPIYDWIEIDPASGGNGISIPLNDFGDEGDVADVTMPFNFNFYGVNYDMLSVCSNGWIAPGGSTQGSFMNSQIPAPQGPSPMIAPFWDDLVVNSGDVFYYHDTFNHAFIIEWSNVTTDFANSPETFQVLIYDPSVYPTPSGDAVIVFQYETVNNTSTGNYSGYPMQHGQYATVGLEDHTGTRGLEYTYNNTYPTAAATLQNEMAIKFTTEGGGAQAPPVLDLNQYNFDFLLSPGTSETQVMEITNLGEANLIYSIEKSYVGYSDETGRGHGGPDNYGYEWFDSDEVNGPQYNWRDIVGIGTEVTFSGSNTGTDLMPIGFDFYFYGTYYSDFRINPNGWIGFGDDTDEMNNLSLPHPWAPNPAIMPFWDNLDPMLGGNVYYFSSSDSLVVWFNDLEHAAGNYSGTYDFQVILYSNGDIVFQYRNMTGDTNSATIGVQEFDADDALQITYNGDYVQNEFAVIIKKIVDWCNISPTYGYIEQGQTHNIDIDVSAEELIPDNFTCHLIITTNDPDNTTVSVPVNLYVSDAFPHIQVSDDEIDFGEVLINDIATETISIMNTGTEILQIINITSDNDAFYVDETSLAIGASGSEELDIHFSPDQTGLYLGTLTIFSNDFVHPELEIELFGEGTETGVNDIIPAITKIDQNFPNPFNPTTNIQFSLAESGKVSLVVYNLKGEKVKSLVDEILEPKIYTVLWNGEDEGGKQVSSGIYFYNFKTGTKNVTKKMILIK